MEKNFKNFKHCKHHINVSYYYLIHSSVVVLFFFFNLGLFPFKQRYIPHLVSTHLGSNQANVHMAPRLCHTSPNSLIHIIPA